MTKRSIALPAALMLAACTTDFSSDGDTSTTDTSGDVIPDGPPPDGPPPDGPPPDGPIPEWHVECEVGRTTYVFLHDTSFDTGCTTDQCHEVNLWMGFAEDHLIVISGGESREGLGGGWFFAAAVDTSGETLDHGDAMNMPMTYTPDDWGSSLRSASLIERDPAVDLLFSRRHYVSGSEVEQELWSLRTRMGMGLNVDHDYQLVMDGVPTAEGGRIQSTRGVLAADGLYLFFVMESEGTGGPSPTQLYGATVPEAQYNSGASWTYMDEFVPLQPTRSEIMLPHIPDFNGDVVIVPYLRMQMVADEGLYHSGLWLIDRPIPAGGLLFTPGMVDFMTERDFDGLLAGSRLGPGGRYGMVALASDLTFTMEGIRPPFNLNVSSVEGLSMGTGGVTGRDVMMVPDSTMRHMDMFDFLDHKVLYNEPLDIFHYVIVQYPAGGDAVVAIYSFDADGNPLMDPPEPYVWEPGLWIMPGFDVVIEPGTGSIFVANFVGAGSEPSFADGYYLNEIRCDLVESP